MLYLSSLTCDARWIGRAIRTHWGIENQLHWVLDVTFDEDASRIRKGHSPENFSLMRRMAISLLNQETSTKRSLRQKAKRAAMDSKYMLQVLATALSPQHKEYIFSCAYPGCSPKSVKMKGR